MRRKKTAFVYCLKQSVLSVPRHEASGHLPLCGDVIIRGCFFGVATPLATSAAKWPLVSLRDDGAKRQPLPEGIEWRGKRSDAAGKAHIRKNESVSQTPFRLSA